MTDKEKILTENLWKLIYRMSLPGIMSMLIISLNAIVDAVFAGRLIGSEALAGIALSIPLLVINAAATGFISSGAANVLSRAIGNHNQERMSLIFSYVIIYALVISGLLTCLGCYFARDLMRLMGAEKGILFAGSEYYKWMMAGCGTSIFGLALSALIRAEGKMKITMTITIISVIANVILNPLLIKYAGLGVKGSALATIIAMGIYTLLTLQYFLQGRSQVKINFQSFSLDKNVIFEIATVGLSALIMQLNGFARQVFLFKTVTWYNNPNEVAFFSATFRIFSFLVIPIFGMLQAMQPIVGINYGAQNYKRSMQALHYFRLSCMILMTFFLIPVLIFPEILLKLILPKMIFSVTDLFHFRLLMCVLLVAPISSTGVVYLQATGKGKISTYLALARELLLFIPLMLCLPIIIGKNGIYYALLLENLIYMCIVLLVVKVQLNSNYTNLVLNPV
jgi:putative MATE family efflux protein